MKPSRKRKRLLVFAHIPPPHHGQAVMVELMLRGLKNDSQIEVFHVDARMSDDLEDVGGVRAGKFFRLIACCMEALVIRVKNGPMDFYYVPAPAKKSAILRDWVVMVLLRPWFRKLIFHWHALGLGHWATGTTEYPLGQSAPGLEPPEIFGKLGKPTENFARGVTRWLLGGCDLSLSLTKYNQCDASLLSPKKAALLANGIDDSQPDFNDHVLTTRLARQQKRLHPEAGDRPTFQCLYLGHCTREKGLFDAIQIFKDASQMLKSSGSPIGLKLVVVGQFMNETERKEYQGLTDSMDCIQTLGFLGGAEKRRVLSESDVLLFPTHYTGETFGLVIVEALMSGIVPLVSNWRGLSEIASVDGIPWFASPENLVALASMEINFRALRQAGISQFSSETFFQNVHNLLCAGD